MLSWLFRNRVFLFLWATVTGFLFALVWKQYEQTIHQTLTYYRITPSSFDYQWAYKSWLSNQGLHSIPVLRKNSSHAHTEPVISENQWLTGQIPVFCIILSKKVKQAKAIKNTWAKHCNRALFYGSFNDNSVPVNKITTKDNWIFLCEILAKVWSGYHEDFKWVLVVSDRTFALVENLRYMVAGLDHNESFYLGHAFRDYNGQYNVEDAGYVLSWRALATLYDKYPTSEACAHAESWHAGDRTLGKVLEEQGIKPKDTRDIMERSRFLPFNLDKLLIPGAISVFSRYWRESVFLSPEGSGCCSDFVITFSDIPPDKMYMMEYIIYHLKPVSRTWPPLEDIGPPPEVPTTAPTVKTKGKSTGKAFVSEITGKKKGQGGENKGSGGDTKTNKIVKVREAVITQKIAENEIIANGKQKIMSNEKNSPALVENSEKTKRERIKNSHTNPDEKENGIEIGAYDEEEEKHDKYGAKNEEYVESLAKDNKDIKEILDNTI